MRWADQLIKLSSFELELLQARLAAVVERRTRAELRLAVLIAGGEAEIAIARTDPEAARSLGAYTEGLKQRKATVQREIDLAADRGAGRPRGARRGVRDAEEVRAGGRERQGRRGPRSRPPRDRRARRDRPEARRGAAVMRAPSPRVRRPPALALAACGQKAQSQPPVSIAPLKSVAPFPVGTCVQAGQLDDPAFAELLAAQVSQLTPEWELKMEYVLQSDGALPLRRAGPDRQLRGRSRHAPLRPHAGLVRAEAGLLRGGWTARRSARRSRPMSRRWSAATGAARSAGTWSTRR